MVFKCILQYDIRFFAILDTAYGFLNECCVALRYPGSHNLCKLKYFGLGGGQEAIICANIEVNMQT